MCDGHSCEYLYDEQGNLKEKRSSGRRLISYTYDKMGQVTEIKDPAGVCTRYKYDVLGRGAVFITMTGWKCTAATMR